MAKKQGKEIKAKKDSPFHAWNTEGDTVEGKFMNFQTTKLGMAIQLDTALVGLGVVLSQYFKDCNKKLVPGKSKIKIAFTGKSKRTKLFDVWLDGKKLVRTSMFGPASPAAVKKFFDSLGA
jgi:hypothetical protein